MSKYFTIFINIPFQKNYCLLIDDANLYQDFSLFFGKLASSNSLNNEDCYTYIIEKCENHYFCIYENQKTQTHDPIAFIHKIINSNFRETKGKIVLHASAIQHNNEAFVFIAPTRTGKTTLIAYLNSKGYNVITDDCAIIDIESKKIHLYEAPIHLREGGYNILNSNNLSLNLQGTVNLESGKRYIIPTNSTSINEIPIRSFIFIKRNNMNFISEKLDKTMVFSKLLISTICMYNQNSSLYKNILELSKIDSYSVIYKDMSFIEDFIKNYESK